MTRGTTTLVGDSLNVGVERYLPDALPHWTIVANDRVGRTTDEGIAELEAGRPALSSYVVVSLGTNDPPTMSPDSAPTWPACSKLIGPSRCVIWATIWRDGKPDDAFNDVLRTPPTRTTAFGSSSGPRWSRSTPAGSPAHLHGNETGYRERPGAVAAATRSCTPAVNLTAQ